MRNKVFAIDFDEKAVRVARCLNLIAGDGQTNVLHLNTLDWRRWNETIKSEEWTETYNDGWKKLKRLLRNKNDYRQFNFDILMANPPFAGDIKQSEMLSSYELAHKANGKSESKVGRDLPMGIAFQLRNSWLYNLSAVLSNGKDVCAGISKLPAAHKRLERTRR